MLIFLLDSTVIYMIMYNVTPVLKSLALKQEINKLLQALYFRSTLLFLPCDSAGVIIIHNMSRILPFPTVNLLLLLILHSLFCFLSWASLTLNSETPKPTSSHQLLLVLASDWIHVTSVQGPFSILDIKYLDWIVLPILLCSNN